MKYSKEELQTTLDILKDHITIPEVDTTLYTVIEEMRTIS